MTNHINLRPCLRRRRVFYKKNLAFMPGYSVNYIL